MNRNDRFAQTSRVLLLLGLAILLSASRALAGERRYYNCTLQQVLSGANDVVLMVEVEDGQLRQLALTVPDQPNALSRIKTHRLTVDGNRLSGPIQIRVGATTEKIDLDVALGKGGTYSVAYGCPEGRREVEGKVTIEAPEDGQSKRWVVWLEGALREGTQLALAFNLDREAKTLEALPASCSRYNRAQYPVDAAKLTFDGTHLEGDIGITVVPDQWVPAHGLLVEGLIELKVSLDAQDEAGAYSAVFGVEKQRPGRVSVRPGSEAQFREVSAPILPPQTPWRVYLVTAEAIVRRSGELAVLSRDNKPAAFDPAQVDPAEFRMSPLPPVQWTAADFDDHCWPRYQGDLSDFLGGWGAEVGDPHRALWPAQLCLRSYFGIADPAKATDLKLSIECIGGAVVYVNGKEVGRGYMPPGDVAPMTPADDYPMEAYTTEDGQTPLPLLSAPKRGERPEPEEKWLPRYNKRIRTITIPIPSSALVRGRNSLAIALHRAAIAGPLGGRAWSHVGFREVKLTSATGSGAISYAEATRGPRVWSAGAVDQVTETPPAKSLIHHSWFWTLYWGRGMPVKGVQQGNPFDPVLPVKMTMPRGGVGSGQTVLSDSEGLSGVAASLAELRGPGGAILPSGAVQIRFAAQHPGVHYCDALMEQAPEGATTVPVWLVIQAPKGQPPGWYVSTLNLEANGKKFRVPVQVLVTGLTLPDAKHFSGSVGMTHSPETVAKYYGVEPWSEDHLQKMEKTLALMGQVGNDVVHVPVLASNVGGTGKSGVQFNWQPMVRWIKTPQGLKPDFSILEKYLDAYSKHCAPPKAISFYIWGASSAKEIADAYEGRRIPSRENVKYSPPTVLVHDPQTGTISESPVPAIGEDGSQQFWKPLLDGARALVTKRGWSERVVVLGLGGDIRPGQKTAELMKQWAPYARWDFLSHFSGDPGPTDGKMIATGGMEVGMKEWPCWTASLRLSQFEERVQKPYDFLELPTDRWMHQEYSPPLVFRTMAASWGCIGRIGLDFWDAHSKVRGSPKSTSFFSHIESLTVPGPEGPVPTVRFQMFREGIQDAEVKTAIVKAYLKLPDKDREPYRALLDELGRRMAWGGPFYLSQCELAYNWPAYVARLHLAAAELAGEKTADRPDEARFRYVAEQAWPVLHYLENRPAGQVEKLVRYSLSTRGGGDGGSALPGEVSLLVSRRQSRLPQARIPGRPRLSDTREREDDAVFDAYNRADLDGRFDLFSSGDRGRAGKSRPSLLAVDRQRLAGNAPED